MINGRKLTVTVADDTAIGERTLGIIASEKSLQLSTIALSSGQAMWC